MIVPLGAPVNYPGQGHGFGDLPAAWAPVNVTYQDPFAGQAPTPGGVVKSTDPAPAHFQYALPAGNPGNPGVPIVSAASGAVVSSNVVDISTARAAQQQAQHDVAAVQSAVDAVAASTSGTQTVAGDSSQVTLPGLGPVTLPSVPNILTSLGVPLPAAAAHLPNWIWLAGVGAAAWFFFSSTNGGRKR